MIPDSCRGCNVTDCCVYIRRPWVPVEPRPSSYDGRDGHEADNIWEDPNFIFYWTSGGAYPRGDTRWRPPAPRARARIHGPDPTGK